MLLSNLTYNKLALCGEKIVEELFLSLICETQRARQDDCYRSCPSEDLTGRLCSR
jgi:hypothetical protein